MWKKIDLFCKTADLVANDRRKAGRDPGRAGVIRAEIEACKRDIAAGFRRISAILK